MLGEHDNNFQPFLKVFKWEISFSVFLKLAISAVKKCQCILLIPNTKHTMNMQQNFKSGVHQFFMCSVYVNHICDHKLLLASTSDISLPCCEKLMGVLRGPHMEEEISATPNGTK